MERLINQALNTHARSRATRAPVVEGRTAWCRTTPGKSSATKCGHTKTHLHPTQINTSEPHTTPASRPYAHVHSPATSHGQVFDCDAIDTLFDFAMSSLLLQVCRVGCCIPLLLTLNPPPQNTWVPDVGRGGPEQSAPAARVLAREALQVQRRTDTAQPRNC